MSSGFRLAGVMGWPIGHSRSPVLHGHWLARHGIAGAYVPLLVEPRNLEQALRALPALGFAGCNLTIPHKEPAIALLDHIDPGAQRIRSVNTIVVGEDGSLGGSSTDGFGFIENLRATVPAWCAAAGPAALIGAGGSARAIAAALADAGVPEICVTNRSEQRAAALVEEFGPPLRFCPWRSRVDALAGVTLVVNSTSQGMVGEAPLELPLDALSPTAVVADIVYVPLETPLLAAARAQGNPTVDGLGMLLHQARPGFAAWYGGVMPDVDDALRSAVLATF
jgi:shikimate dehydrogenase